MVSSPTNANSVINYTPSCRSKPENKLRYFWWNPRTFWSSIDSNATTTFKAQKGSKDIVKMWHHWFNHNFMKLREQFVCKENKKSQKALRFHQNILNCALKMNKGLTGLERHEGWEINDRILTNPLKSLTAQLLLNTIYNNICIIYSINI